MTGRYDFDLVVLSIAVAVMSAYCALDLSARISVSSGRAARSWLAAGALGMGAGIWSMHFIGMIAFRLPVPIHYDLLLTGASLLIAVLASALALHLASRPRLSFAGLLGGGAAMGLGISAMHYLGMAAIPMVPAISYRPGLLALSVLIAVAASMLALGLAFALRGEGPGHTAVRRIGAAVLMGLAISGMHYSGMAAAHFPAGGWCSTATLLGLPYLSAADLGYGIGLFVIATLGLMILASFVDERIARHAVRSLEVIEQTNRELRREIEERERAERALADESTRRRTIFEQAEDGIVLLDEDRSVVEANPSFARMLGYERDALIGKHPWDWDLVYSTRESTLARWPEIPAESGLIESRFRRQDGSWFWAEIRHSLVRWAGRSLLFCVCRDITERKRAALAIAENVVRYSTVLETLADGVIVIDEGGCIQEVNAAAQRIFGYDAGEMLGCNIRLLMAAPYRDAHQDYLRNYLDTGRAGILGVGREVAGQRKDGSVFPLDLSVSEMHLGDRTLFTGIVRDITERRAQQDRVVRLTRMRALLGGINALILRVSTWEELFRETCRIAVEQGGFSVAWIGMASAGRTQPVASAGALGALAPILRQTLPDADGEPASLAAAIGQREQQVIGDVARDCGPGYWRDALLAAGCRAAIDLPLVLRDRLVATASFYGQEPGMFDSEEEVQLLRDLAGDVAHGMEFIERAEELSFLASYDALTRLANRGLFVERLARALRNARQGNLSVAVVMLDIQNFKGVNDAFGHAYGDELLKEFAGRLADAAGGRDAVARIAGDSFAAIVPQDADAAAADPITPLDARIRGPLATPYLVNGQQQFLGVRMGIALFPRDGEDGEKLLRSAEAALKEARNAGDSVRVSSAGGSTAFGERLTLRTQLHHAVQRNEFELHYQPKLRLSDGCVTGVEALLRWNRADGGMVSPAMFVPVLEQTGLVVDVGRWVLHQALRDRQAWLRAGFELRVAVNLSPMQLRHRDLVGMFVEALNGGQEGAPGLDVEVTESMLMHDLGASTEKLVQLRRLGIGVAIDDFGTGYSSLSYLATLPIDTLKIDRSFVVKMCGSEANLSVVKGIVSLARSLGYRLVAEGVEEPAQVEVLRDLGCEELQGWIFSPALPSTDLLRLLLEGRRLQS